MRIIGFCESFSDRRFRLELNNYTSCYEAEQKRKDVVECQEKGHPGDEPTPT